MQRRWTSLRRSAIALVVALSQLLISGASPLVAATDTTSEPSSIVFTRFESAGAFGLGTHDGTEVRGETIALADGTTSGTWTSSPIEPGFDYSRLIGSSNADTPGASWIRVDARPTTSSGSETAWYSLGIWAAGDELVKRTSIVGQADGDARVDTDTLIARGAPLSRYRLRVTLERASADEPSPLVRMLGAVVSNGGSTFAGEASAPSAAGPIELPVPRYSQEIHTGDYPQWDGGGARWCSPTSTQMVVAYWGHGPANDDLAWTPRGHVNADVDFAARGTYDVGLRGTGNWSFNVAYAAHMGLRAFVTQLRSLAEAESFVRAGIPVVASTKPGVFGLDGYLFPGSVEGHLLVIVGFDADGNPIVNDPAAWSNATVRKVYDRAQLERAWLGGSGGVAYIIHPYDVPLPGSAFAATSNW
jgi:hypothetical protein